MTTSLTAVPKHLRHYVLSTPAVSGEMICEGHAQVCAILGHMTHTVDGVLGPRCPRCDELIIRNAAQLAVGNRMVAKNLPKGGTVKFVLVHDGIVQVEVNGGIMYLRATDTVCVVSA